MTETALGVGNVSLLRVGPMLVALAILGLAPSADRLFAQKNLSLAETEKQFTEAMQSGPVEALAAFYSEDAVMMVQAGPMLKGRHQIMQQFLLPSGKAGLSMTSKTIDIAESGDLGYTAGTTVLKGPSMALGGKWVAIWKRLKGEWKIAYAIANTDPPMPK